MKPGDASFHPHGAARIRAGFGLDPALPPPLPAAVSEGARVDAPLELASFAWELVYRLTGWTAAERGHLGGLLWLVLEATARGSTRFRLEDADVDRRAAQLGFPEAARRGLVLAGRRIRHALRPGEAAGGLTSIVGGPEKGRPLVLEGAYLYPRALYELERSLAADVARRVGRRSSPTTAEVEAVLHVLDSSASAGPRPSSSDSAGPRPRVAGAQRAAVVAALTEKLVAVAGGPGTGKTSIALTMVRALMALGELRPADVVLAAPTGKAADRLRSALHASLSSVDAPLDGDRPSIADPNDFAPCTLHRLLGYSPRRRSFRHHRGYPLSARFVLVDECSMVDLFLMQRLLEALPEEATLVLMGDADQLPSVAAGAVFRDLVAAERVPSVVLTESYRMNPAQPAGRAILTTAKDVHQGRVECLAALKRARPDAPLLRLEGVHLVEAADRSAREAFLDAWYRAHIEPSADLWQRLDRTWTTRGAQVEDADALCAVFEHFAAARLLCVTRGAGRPTGAEAVNASLLRRYRGGVSVRDPAAAGPRAAEAPGSRLDRAPGEPILVTHNDAERGLYNGDQGCLLWTAERGEPRRLRAVFANGAGSFVAFAIAPIERHSTLGYATTVHKAQGSEHEAVALLLPEVDLPHLFTREVVYTAITRARRSVFLVGSERTLHKAVGRPIERSTGLRDRLRGQPAPDH